MPPFLYVCGMKILLVAAFFLGVLPSAFSQYYIHVDTVKPPFSYLSSAALLDSFTQSSRSIYPTLHQTDGLFFDPFRVFHPFGAYTQQPIIQAQNAKFTALPYLGFAFAFGTQASQHIDFSYYQSFKKGWHAQLGYKAHASNGYLRNNSWRNRAVHGMLTKTSRRYRSQIHFQTSSDYRQFSGGIINDSLPALFALNLIPVRKDSCNSLVSVKRLEWKNEVNFLKDSSRFFGFLHRSSLQNNERSYQEYDTLSGLYPTIYFDSLSTQDRHEVTRMDNGIGLGFRNRKAQIQTMLVGDYWRFRMNSFQRDTLEIGVKTVGSIQLAGLDLEAGFSANLLGAFRENATWLSANKSFSDALKFNGELHFTNSTPDLIQRFYYGNTMHITLSTPDLQSCFQARLGLRGRQFGLDYVLDLQGLFTDNVYQFVNNAWTNQTAGSKQQVLHVNLRVAKEIMGWNFEPTLQYWWQKESFLPEIGIGTSVGYRGYVTKAKNLLFLTRLSYKFYYGYKTFGLNPLLSSLDFSSAGQASLPYHAMNFLVGFRVKTFQFYSSVDNLGVFMMDRIQPLYAQIPIPSLQIKLGISWEFWN